MTTTTVAVPYAEDGLFPPCPIAGCNGITDAEGQPCTDCIELFGEYLTHNPGGRTMTTPEILRHKADTLAAYRAQTTAPAVEALPDISATLADLDQIRARLDARDHRKPALRRRNQTCWCCTERRTCTRNDRGLWECDTCASIS